jgi:hypothetical protein
MFAVRREEPTLRGPFCSTAGEDRREIEELLEYPGTTTAIFTTSITQFGPRDAKAGERTTDAVE